MAAIFRGIFDGRYKLVRYFGLGHYHLPGSVEELLATNDVALYDLPFTFTWDGSYTAADAYGVSFSPTSLNLLPLSSSSLV